MDGLLIKQSDFSPLVNFDLQKNVFEIKGESRPENTSKFYEEILSWLAAFGEYLNANPSNTNFNFHFKLDYFNSTSAKFILDMLRQLETINMQQGSTNITIHWYHDKLDDDMRDSGEEFSQLVQLPFVFIEY
jgi:SiaC family regulatory phosphoprotein